VFTGSAWSRVTEPDGSPGQWYLHLFDSSQPDLNWNNPEVRADLLQTIEFWLDRGVDGFRIDVAMGMGKDMSYPDVDDPEGSINAIRLDLFDGSPESFARRDLMKDSPVFDRDDVHEIFREWRALIDSRGSDNLSVGEAWVHPPARARLYTREVELHQIFNFDFLVTPWDTPSLAAGIERALEPAAGPPTWALDNHDTPRVASRLGGGAAGLRRAHALAMLVLFLPGSVYIYQGQELGLEDVDVPGGSRQDPVYLRSGGKQLGRDGARVPIPWSGETTSYGFSAEGVIPWLPQIDDWSALTREAQSIDPRSTLAMYRRALALRRQFREAWSQSPAEADVIDKLLVVRRGSGFVSVTNTTDIALPTPIAATVVLDSSRTYEPGAELVEVPANSTVWCELRP
jgi:alpha-glucosidase